MIKNMLKRTWLNIIRKPSKSIILLVIMFVMANLVIASLAISNSVEESTKYAKQTIGSEVYLNADMEKAKEGFEAGKMQGQGSMSGDMSDMMESMKSMARPESTINMVTDIANSEYVKDLTYSLNTSAEPTEITLYETETQGPGGNMGRGQMMSDNISGLKVMGINSYVFIPEVESNIMTISEGEYFDETTDDQILISYELAELNSLSVGSIVKLQNSETGEIIEYTVRGIFTANESGYENNIYMNVESAAKLLNSETYNGGDYSVSSVVFTMNNPDETDLFIEEVNNKYDLEELGLTLDIDTTAYDQMVGPIEQVGGFADTILIVVVIAAALIITLIINNSIKSRKYEMGVLMSLGATRRNIIGQILLELIIVATMGFILSIGTSTILANSLSEGLLEDQIQMSEEQSEENFGRPSGQNMGGGMSGTPGTQGNDSTADVEAITEIDVSISLNEYLLLFGIGYLISFISMIVPAINIMKYQPKTILTGRES